MNIPARCLDPVLQVDPESMTCQTTISQPAYHITKCLNEAKFMSSRLAKYCLKNWISVGFNVLATCACSLTSIGSISKGKWREWLCHTLSCWNPIFLPSADHWASIIIFLVAVWLKGPSSFSPINISILLCAYVLQTARIKANNLASHCGFKSPLHQATWQLCYPTQ